MSIVQSTPLPITFYQNDTVLVAQALIGTIIIRQWNNTLLAGIIAETEAHGGHDDPASHAYQRCTSRNAAMFGPVGHTYIYFIYGNHYCLNIVARNADQQAGAVLIRVIIPMQGQECMTLLRRKTNVKELTNGPGKLCQALALRREHNSHDVTQKSTLYISKGIFEEEPSIIKTPRIGISKAQGALWRFVLKI